jgi:hypothetical protein
MDRTALVDLHAMAQVRRGLNAPPGSAELEAARDEWHRACEREHLRAVRARWQRRILVLAVGGAMVAMGYAAIITAFLLTGRGA